jgi:hypothetical protein
VAAPDGQNPGDVELDAPVNGTAQDGREQRNMSQRLHCDEFLAALPVVERGLRSPLEGITEAHLNHIFAPHKMTIGQIAVHSMSWPRWFLSSADPWELTEWTCRPCVYPLTVAFVEEVINDGVDAMRSVLERVDDSGLERTPDGKKGPGYILFRLLHHTMVHANQMAYLRHTLDPEWGFGRHFGEMASALIRVSYHTEPEGWRRGF